MRCNVNATAFALAELGDLAGAVGASLPGTPLRATGRSTTSPKRHRRLRGNTVAQGLATGDSGNSYAPAGTEAHRDARHPGQRQHQPEHTLSGNEVDFLNNAGTIRGKKYTA